MIPLVLLLVTPSYIEFLRDGGPFVPNLLRRLFKQPKSGQEFDVAAAVVDRIPYPVTRDLLAEQVFGNRRHYGCEGISVLISDSKITAPDLWSPRKGNTNQQTKTVSQPSVISFRIEPTNKFSSLLNSGFFPYGVSRTFQLPVANTMFHNERISTLFAARWISAPTVSKSKSKLDSVFVRTKSTELLHQKFNLVDTEDNSMFENSASLNMAIKQITPPQVVAAALGNIVCKLHAGKNPDEEIPASENLEKAVDRAINAETYPNQQVSIWALVTPRECRPNRPVVRNHVLQDMIECGSRLHRVLGGGGGWGAKKGLLALDPAFQYMDDQDEAQQSFGVGKDIDAETVQSLGDIVRPGDVIAFYIQPNSIIPLPKSPNKTPRPLGQIRSRSCLIDAYSSIHIGTLPSSTETLPSCDAASDGIHQVSDFIFAKEHFGMLSEHGMSLKIEKYGLPESPEPFGSVVTTKVDPPFSWFSTVRVYRNPKILKYSNPELQKSIIGIGKTSLNGLERRDYRARGSRGR